MMLRFALPFAALALASCSVMRGVTRKAELPPEVVPAEIPAAVMAHPSAPYVSPWDGKELWVAFGEGDAQVLLACYGRTLYAESLWLNRVPEPAVLRRSLQMQEEVIQLLRARFPGIPSIENWAIRWDGIDAPPEAVAGEP
jgi:hypothetical protein